MSAAKIKNVELTFFMDSLLESFCPKSAIAKPFGISRCMLRASTEKQSEKSTARNAEGRNLRFLLLLRACHLSTLSALASTFGGIVRPISFAAFKLIINSNLVGCSTGRSAGFAPFRILST